MTDTLTTTVQFTPGMTIDAMRAAGVGPVLGTVREQWLRWCREASQPGTWGDAVIDDPFMRGEAQTTWARDFVAFSAWSLTHPELFATAAVPSGDKVAPIGPDTPGWDDFWERVAQHARDDGYEEQYNTLAEAFGAATIEDGSEEIDVEIEVDVTARVTITVSMTRAQYSGNWDLNDYESDLDEAVRQYSRRESFQTEIVDYRQV